MNRRLLLITAVAIGAALYLRADGSDGTRLDDAGSESAPIHDVGVSNAAGRSGAYYAPLGLSPVDVPVLVLMHPTGSSGRAFIPAFRSLADSLGFLIVAPDSRTTPTGVVTWQVGDRQGDVTDDLLHTMSVLEWVRRETLLVMDESRVLIAGFSGGASMAPYIATNRSPFTHAAVLHGRVFTGGLGRRGVRTWLSTGAEDDFAPVGEVRSLAAELRRLRYDVTEGTYSGGHGLSADEKADLIAWWLGP